VPEPYAVKVARTVLRGRKLPGTAILKNTTTMFKHINNFIRMLLLGQEKSQPTNKLRPAIKNQWLNVKRIWTNEHYNDFGIERLIRLTLALLLFIFPGLYIRAIFSKFGLLGRKLGVEFYVLIKLALPIIFFKLDWTNNIIVVAIVVVMAIETVVYLAALIFLSNEFARPISYSSLRYFGNTTTKIIFFSGLKSRATISST
jgi:hypothetical protein